MGPEFAIALLMALAGLVVGSFLATAALRWTRGEQAIRGRSHCDGCGRTLSVMETLPLAGYVRARGACGACGRRIDGLHLVGELGGGAIAFAAFALLPLPVATLVTLMGWTLLLASLIDWRALRLPNVLTAIVAGLGFVLATLRGFEAVIVGLIGGAITFALLYGVRLISARRGEPGLGFGDIKLAAALALWLGWKTPWMGVASAAIGLLAMAFVRPRSGKLPFGPFIAMAGFGLGFAQERGW